MGAVGIAGFQLKLCCNVATGLALAEVGDLEEALKDHEQARSLAEENHFLQSSLGADILVNMGIAKAWCHETRCLPYLVSL